MDIKTIIFDLDGTLYELKGGSFIKSGIYDEMIQNTILFISRSLGITQQQATDRLTSIRKIYGNEISMGIEGLLGLNRLEYFNFAWDIDPRKYVQYKPRLAEMLSSLSQDYQLIVLTDAPRVWAKNVLAFLGLTDMFKDNVYTGESDIRKSNGTAHSQLINKLDLKGENCFFVGDEVKNDLLPAKVLGITTVLVSTIETNHPSVDHQISNILQLVDISFLNPSNTNQSAPSELPQ